METAVVLLQAVIVLLMSLASSSQELLPCGGFVQSRVKINYSLVIVKLYTKQGILKQTAECAPNNGYFMVPIYDKGSYIIKVEPPTGWSFEPSSVELVVDGKTDKCSNQEDINFVFTGFSLSGKVLSKGREQGPSGVDILLSGKEAGEEGRKTATTEGGLFTFTQIFPGEYSVTASHNTWTFEKMSSEVSVGDGNTKLSEDLIVSGYDVKGHVLSDGQPIQGVEFLLFSNVLKPEDVTNCDKISAETLNAVNVKSEYVPLCSVKSNSEGSFIFPSVPSGDYTLIPFYHGEHITFDVVPSRLKFTVNYKSVVLKTPFQVHGFSVSGKVVGASEDQGVGEVTININGVDKTITTEQGIYILENITAGSYAVQASKPDYYFEPLQVHITPNTPKLPDIKASGYNVCGKIVIDVLPSGATPMEKRKVMINSQGGQPTDAVTMKVESSGKFCFKAAPGSYVLQALVSPEERSLGLILKPDEQVVQVVDKPVLGLVITQFRAAVSGTVQCIGGSCGTLSISLTPSTKSDQSKAITLVKSTADVSSFQFDNVLPGKYKVAMLQDTWCWQNKSIEFEVADKDVSSLQFVQSGFILKCSLSHPITLHFSLNAGKDVVGSFNLTKGINKFCLSEPGIYNLIPMSCHKFEHDVYKYDTSSVTVLTLTATKHLLSGHITTLQPAADIQVKLKSLRTKSEVVLGPLKADESSNEKAAEDTKKEPQAEGKETKEEEKVEEKVKEHLYKFSHWGRSDEEFEIAVSSSELLFYPPNKKVKITDECPGTSVQFEGRVGMFIDGQIEPALGGVKVTITHVGKDGLPDTVITAETGENGQYRVGPLHSDFEYSLSAVKEGYVMTTIDGKRGFFRALKLGQISFKVTDEEDKPLSGVLLSLSGGQFRSNNVTYDNGTMLFNNLSPGQYFFRSMLKEYEFDPASQMIDVLEGSTVEIAIKAKRVAFSCYGSITSLNGEPEKGISVEAVGLGTCEGMQEDTATDKDGGYRLRGLQPGCTYRLRVKIGESNPHIERASPAFVDLQIASSDIFKINLLAFRHLNQFEVTGNVITDKEFVSSVKIALFKESNMDNPLQTTTLGVTSFFQFPPLPNDGQSYVLRLESTLSQQTHSYQKQEVVFTTSGTQKHVSFKFEPKVRKVDHDVTQGSYLALPVLILAFVLIINHNKILPFLQQGVQFIQGLPTEQMHVAYDEGLRNKRKRR